MVGLLDPEFLNIAFKAFGEFLAIACFYLVSLLAQLADQALSLCLFLALLVTGVQALLSLLFDSQDLIVLDNLAGDLPPFLFSPVVLKELVHIIVLVLVKAAFDAVLVNVRVVLLEVVVVAS